MPIGRNAMSKTEILVQRVKQMIDSHGYAHSDRLPCEREMCQALGVTRNQLRRALAELEGQGLIWRHVGRGTFLGARPVLNLEDVTYLRDRVKPAQVVSVRLTIEPALARLAAIYGKKADHAEIQHCADRCRNAPDWRGYEAWDNKLHHAIARASQNQLHLYYFETLNVVRRSVVWGQPRKTIKPADGYSSFREHDVIVQAILNHDADLAAQSMIDHLRSVYSRILPSMNLGIPEEYA
jgi:DNA-binding FadR family transcriptional regulator